MEELILTSGPYIRAKMRKTSLTFVVGRVWVGLQGMGAVSFHSCFRVLGTATVHTKPT